MFIYLDVFAEFRLFLIAGGDTTSHSMEYGLIYLSKYPELQNELYNELSKVFKDKNNINLYSNVGKLHVFRAFIRDILRLSSVATYGFPRRAIKAIPVQIYDDILKKDIDVIIPKNSVIMGNIPYANKCSPYWKEYNTNKSNNKYGEINLDAWLETTNNGNKVFKMNNNFVSFSIGKRNCIGMSLALKEIQCFFAHMIMNYKFSLSNANQEITQSWGVIRRIDPEIGIIIKKRY